MRKTLLVVGVVVLCTLVLACSLGVEAAKGTSRVHSKDAKLKRAAQVSSIASRKSFFKRDVCPGGGNCNNHGLCNTDNTCSCVNGYAGVDCSILDSEAQFGKLYSGSVARQQWSFYHIDISPDLPAFSVNANQTSDEGDCDLYIQKGSYPSKSSFYEKDNTLSNEMTIAVANPESATWFAGIYGFQACQYSFRINSNAVACSCSGHGVCFGSATNCTCENTYYGNQCQYQLKELKPNVVLTDSITVRTWRYYTFAATKKNNVYFNITEIGNGDSDLYIKYGKYPTFTDYDAKDISLQSNYQVLLNNVQVGTYYVGMYGYTNSSYSILTTISTECGNLCSNHGTCNGDTCTCSSGFSGSVCENYVPALALGQPVAGFVYPGVWNYFHYTANSEDSLKVTTYQTDKTGDCDLFVRAGQNPNRFNYDYLDVSFAVNTSITIPNPGSQTWYIGVLGYRTCTFSVAVQVVAKPKDCDPACVNGQCSAGVCVCNSGYAGATCASSLSPISIAVATSGTVTPNGWVYYSISQSSSTFVNIFVNEPNSPAGLLEVYISDDGAIPDRTNYAAKGSLSGSTTTIALSRDGRTYDYIIGIYGTLNGNGQSIQYNVVAHQTSF